MNANNKKFIEKIEDLEKRMSILEDLVKDAVKSAAGTIPSQEKGVSLKEFLLSKKPTDNVKKTLAVGYYLEKFENVSPFSINDLKKAFERAKETKPANINDKVNMNIRNGHMDEASEKKGKLKAWYLTGSGESHVERLGQRGK